MRTCAWIGLGLLAGSPAWSQQYLISTVAGGGAPFTPAAAASVGLAPPAGTATDASGSVYFSSGSFVFKVDASGLLTRVAGSGTAGYSGDAGPATSAQLNLPRGVAVDGSGNLYIADSGNNVVRKVAVDGVISTVAGAAVTSAQLNSPAGVAVDPAGNLYVADSGNNLVLKLTAPGVLATVAGNGSRGYSGDGGPATSAELNFPEGLAIDGAGNLFITDSGNSVIRRVAVNGMITAVAGVGGVPGYFGDGGLAAAAHLNGPSSVALDPAGNLYIADTGNYVIRKVTADGKIATIAGNHVPGYAGDGGAASSAELWSPWGVAADSAGNVFIADSNNYRVRVVRANGTIATLAGNGTADYRGDGGPATRSQLVLPRGVAVDASGNVYIADTNGNTVRKVAPDGTIATVAGTGVRGYTGDGGLATASPLSGPQGVAVDSTGNIYIADTGNQRVREVTIADGKIATLAGTGLPGYGADGTTAATASLNSPTGVAVDSSGNVFIVDHANNAVREITGGIIATVAGAFNAGYSGDGGAARNALLNSPTSVAFDAAGNLFIADYFNHAIRRVDFSTGNISTVAGNGTPGYSGDGSGATSAQLFLPWGVWVDSSGNLFIGDSQNNVIREVTGTTISTVAGSHVAGYSGDGGSATGARLNGPSGVAVDSAGNVYVADANNNAIRLLAPAGSRAVLSAAGTHAGFFQPGQNGAAYSVVVSNAAGAGATSGAVTVTATLSGGVTLAAMSGAGWSCSGNACTRSDALAGGSSYPAIAVTVNLAAAVSQAVIQVAVSGGGGPAASATDAAVVLGAPSAPVPVSPANGVVGVSTAPVLSWSAGGATSFEVYFGTSSAPPLVETTAENGYSPGELNPGATYYWQIVARNSVGAATSPVWSFTTGFSVAGLRFVAVAPCRVADTRGAAGQFGGPSMGAGSTRTFAIPLSACGIPATAQAYSLNVTAAPRGSLPYLTVWPAGVSQPGVSTLNSWDGTVVANAAIVPAGSSGAVNVYAAGPTDVILDVNGYFEPAAGASFYTVTPCRAADTRGPAGPLGGPSMAAGESRDFPVLSSACGIPSGAGAYSLNVTAVPDPAVDFLAYLTTWAAGQPRPLVSTLNSWTGTVVANAAIVPAASDGSISVFVTDPADVILDTNGYFAAPASPGALSFYPIAPCRVADTRGGVGPFGGPVMEAGSKRSFAIPASSCYVPPSAAAYALNVTVVPDGPLSFLTAWPTGSAQPFVSTLNALDGRVVANAAIVPAGAGGAVSIYVTNRTHVIVDLGGYFAP